MSTHDDVAAETRGLIPFLRFFVPSMIGLLLFLVPFPTADGGFTILFGLYSEWINAQFGFFLVELMLVLAVIASVASIFHLLVKTDWSETRPVMHAIAATSIGWVFLRTVGALIGLMVYFEFGPEILRLEDTGVVVLTELTIAFVIVILPACFLMPLLTEFGAMDFFGTLIAPTFRSLFKLPGRAAVDATASFISASNIGILVTGQQYRRGFYTGREAVAVGTNFSVVSLPFALVIANVSGIGNQFFAWYMVAILACVVCAIVTARIPPISRIPNEFIDGEANEERARKQSDAPILKRALDNAIKAAAKTPPPQEMARLGNIMMFEQIFGIIGPLLTVATLAAVAAFHSPIGEWISAPVAWLLSVLDVENATKVAPGFLFGFFDQYIPAIVASGIDSMKMKFVLAGLSLTQLIFMAETGLVILRVGLPATVWVLAQIFVLRTLISLPILVVGANLLY